LRKKKAVYTEGFFLSCRLLYYQPKLNAMRQPPIIRYAIAATILLLMQTACKKNSYDTTNPTDTTATSLTDEQVLAKVLSLPVTPFNYANITLPQHFQNPGIRNADNANADNPITDAGATLGRVIFYDKMLSANSTVACASCHHQANSFTDVEKFSKGFENGLTTRNSMSLANARFYQPGAFFWDERAATLEDQVLLPIQHPVEMGMTLDSIEARLGRQAHYKILFRRAFGDESITRVRVSKALSQFIRSMVSYQSRYDDGRAALGRPPAPGDRFANFTNDENEGMVLYQQHCAPCHGTDLQIANQARNNGLDMVYTDNGKGDITKNAADNGKFKSPSLRNVALTAPYMHDGRFATLIEVVRHYNNGIQNHPNLDPRLRVPPQGQGAGQPVRLNLSQQQQDQLVAFLHTLTDNQFITDIKFSDPFLK
jgi:cytochrome c peroxidase